MRSGKMLWLTARIASTIVSAKSGPPMLPYCSWPRRGMSELSACADTSQRMGRTHTKSNGVVVVQICLGSEVPSGRRLFSRSHHSDRW